MVNMRLSWKFRVKLNTKTCDGVREWYAGTIPEVDRPRRSTWIEIINKTISAEDNRLCF